MADLLEQLVTQHGLDQKLDVLRRYVLPCVGFSLTPQRGSDTLGASRLGGSPDVPAGFELPTASRRPLEFLLQLKLDELPRHGLSERLPPDGLLSFFYDLREQPWGFDPKELDGFRVFYFRAADGLEPVSIESEYTLPERSLCFWRAWSLPAYGSRSGERLYEDLQITIQNEDEWNRLDSLSHALFRSEAPTRDGPAHRIGGHSENQQGDMQLEAQLVMNGLHCGNAKGYQDRRRRELESSCEEWQLLLQLDSDDDAEFMWGDCGMLYFWLREHDLQNQDFSRSWMGLQCG